MDQSVETALRNQCASQKRQPFNAALARIRIDLQRFLSQKGSASIVEGSRICSRRPLEYAFCIAV